MTADEKAAIAAGLLIHLVADRGLGLVPRVPRLTSSEMLGDRRSMGRYCQSNCLTALSTH